MNGTKDIIATTTTWILPIARLGCASATLLACTAAQPHPAPPTPTPTPPLNRPTYHLLQPVPRPLLRTLGTDRPDQTESPQTVDAGHFQVEMDLVNATFDRSPSEGGDRRTEVVALAPLNLKVGLLHNTDLQLVLAPYIPRAPKTSRRRPSRRPRASATLRRGSRSTSGVTTTARPPSRSCHG